MYKITKLILPIFIAFALLSCDNTIFNDVKVINNGLWEYNDSISFNIKVNKENEPFNVYIDIENTDNYKYSNLFLFVNITSPNNTTITDTIDVFMADYKGKWVGNPKGDNYYGNYLFKRAVAFPKAGIYKTTITQGMRADTLKGITKIGITVKEISN